MAEVTGLYIVLIVIYASECIVWTRPDDWIFCGLRRGHWVVHHGPQFLLGDKNGLTIVGVIPPLPMCILIPREKDFFKSKSATLSGSKGLSFDMKALTERTQKLEEESLLLRIIGNLLFLMIFLVLPAILWMGVLSVYWRPLLIMFVYFWILGVAGFFIAHRRLFPKESRQRLRKTLLIGVSPLNTIRAANQLTKDLLTDFHPVAVCYALCSQADFERNARMAYCDEATEKCGSQPGALSAISRSFKSDGDCHIAKFLKSVDRLGQLLKPPTREDSLSNSYCPRCHCQYRAGFETCIDCNGIQLVSFK